MKVFLCENLLLEAGENTSAESTANRLIDTLISYENFSLWTSALSVINIQRIIDRMPDKKNISGILEKIEQNFSIIPFRKSHFSKAILRKENQFTISVQIDSAEEFNMDCIITVNKNFFDGCSIPVFNVSEFLKKLESNEFDDVKNVPFMDLKAQHHQIYNEIEDRYADIIANTGFILGKYVNEFEEKFAEIQEAKYCVGVSSGTDALHVALMALGIGHGDGVIVPVHTFIATAEAVSLSGATPVFCDCDEFYNIDIEGVDRILKENSRTNHLNIKAIIPVHLYGQPVKIDEIMTLAAKYDVTVIEDACQAHLAEHNGRKVGNWGAYGAFSFYPGKNLGAFGEGGALITNDENLYMKAKMIRQHGEIERYHHSVVGHNYRMSALQGAALGVKLKYIEEWTKKRQWNADLYSKLLRDIPGVDVPREIDGVSSVYHLYVIQVDDRDGLMDYLKANNIIYGLHYPIPLHLQEAYKNLGYKEGDFPVVERLVKRILSLPMFPELTENQIQYVCEKIRKYYE